MCCPPQGAVLCIHVFCHDVLGLCGCTPLLAEGLENPLSLWLFFFLNKKQGKVGKDLAAFCQAAVNLSTEPPALPYSHAVLVSGASEEAVTPRGLGASSAPGCRLWQQDQVRGHQCCWPKYTPVACHVPWAPRFSPFFSLEAAGCNPASCFVPDYGIILVF